MLPNPVTYATPVFVVLVLAEVVWARIRRPAYYNPRDAFASLSLGVGSTVAGAGVAALVAAAGVWVWRYRLFDVPYAWWSWALCFVLDDLAYYAFHRSAHRVRWFWASHVVHHSSQHYNLSTALRQTWTGFVSLAFVFRLPLFLIGFPPPMIFFCGGLNLIYQFWIHTELIGRMPRWFEAVMKHALAPPGPPRHQSALPRPQLCGRLHRLGPDVRQLRARTRQRADPLWHRQEPRQLQSCMGGLPRMGRDRAGPVVRAVGIKARLPVEAARLES